MMCVLGVVILFCVLALPLAPAHADIAVSAVVSIARSAAALGGSERKMVALVPAQIAGQKVRTVIDDASGTAGAVRARSQAGPVTP